MSVPPPAEKYDTVSEAEDDIHTRLSFFPGSDEWLLSTLMEAVLPTWTDALTSFSANSEVSREESIALLQIKSAYKKSEPTFEKRAALLGSGTMSTLHESHVLFIVLFRDLQQKTGSRVNMNPHKLRVLLDDRFSVKKD